MNNHIYEFSNEVHVQTDEGSIGVEFTGVASEIYMLKWCYKLKNKLLSMHIRNDLQPRMVDDITLLPQVLQPGARIENGVIIIKEDKVKEDELVSSDIRTMNIIQEIANSIDENIKVTYDVPSLHYDGMVPILDVKAKVNSNGKIEHKFYKKPCANRLITMKDSAFSMRNKITILTQECFRRLHNTSEFVSDEEKSDILNEFMKDLKLSGYSESERRNILEAGVKTYLKLKMKEKDGIRPFYRDKFFQKDGKYNSKKCNASKWFKNGKKENNFISVMFVDATPEDRLLKMFKDTESKHRISEKCRIKFVTKSGIKLKNILTKNNNVKKECTDKDGNPRVNTHRSNKNLLLQEK